MLEWLPCFAAHVAVFAQICCAGHGDLQSAQILKDGDWVADISLGKHRYPVPGPPGVTASYKVYKRDAFCTNDTATGMISKYGNTPRGIYKTKSACETACTNDMSCWFYLYKDEPVL